MFDNLINLHDATIVVEKMRQGAAVNLLRRALPLLGRGSGLWDRVVLPLKNWWDIPRVMERWNIMVSGDPKVDYLHYYAGKYLKGKCELVALTVGSGTGHRELEMEKLGVFSRIDGIDVSRTRVEYAKEKAREAGVEEKVKYMVGDIFDVELGEGEYDLVLVEQTLHHLSPLEVALDRISGFLKSGGFLLLNEYVGPSRFQWTNLQLEVVNALLTILPEKYRKRWRSGTLKKKEYRTGKALMWLYDRTEAVESDRIMGLMEERFEPVEKKGYGGTVLMALFRDIAQNFLSPDSDTEKWLDICFFVEDFFLENGLLEHDFMTGIYRKR